MKRCPACGETKQVHEFYAAPARDDGLAGHCIPCSIAAGAASVLKLRLEVTRHLGGCCAHCGYNVPGPALQVDHVDGDGAAERKANASPRRVLRDALNDTEGRYQLLCANCNQIKRMENAEHKGSRVYVRVGDDTDRAKRCAACDLTKPTAFFYRNGARRDGLSIYCGRCTLKRGARANQAARQAAVDHLGGKCFSCGYDANRHALQIDHANGGGAAERKSGNGGAALCRAVVADASGRYQLLCANCNVIKKITSREFRRPDTYVRNPAKERRPTRQYLSPDQIAEVARLVAVEGLPQAEVGERYGITQPVVGRHVKNHYPDYNGRLARWVQFRTDRSI